MAVLKVIAPPSENPMIPMRLGSLSQLFQRRESQGEKGIDRGAVRGFCEDSVLEIDFKDGNPFVQEGLPVESTASVYSGRAVNEDDCRARNCGVLRQVERSIDLIGLVWVERGKIDSCSSGGCSRRNGESHGKNHSEQRDTDENSHFKGLR